MNLVDSDEEINWIPAFVLKTIVRAISNADVPYRTVAYAQADWVPVEVLKKK